MEETERGWYVTLIAEDPFKKIEEKAKLKRSYDDAVAQVQSDRVIKDQVGSKHRIFDI